MLQGRSSMVMARLARRVGGTTSQTISSFSEVKTLMTLKVAVFAVALFGQI